MPHPAQALRRRGTWALLQQTSKGLGRSSFLQGASCLFPAHLCAVCHTQPRSLTHMDTHECITWQ